MPDPLPFIGLPFVHPVMVVLWTVFSVRLNERAARCPRPYSLKLPLDDRIPFIPAFALHYFSAYILANAGYVGFLTNPHYPKIALGYLTLFASGLLAYWLFPCRVERREALTGRDFSTRLLAGFQRRAKPFNSFPSMHVAYCLFSALMLSRYSPPWLSALCLGWAGLVAAATLFTKQHHLLDVAAGAALAAGVVWLVA